MSLLYPFLVAAAGLAPVLGVTSLLLLLLAAALRRRPALPPAAAPPRLAVIVPAHDEEVVLAATLISLQVQEYPRDSYEVVVVADNCTDRTAQIAREYGVTVLERFDASARGKGYALNHAISHLLGRPAPPDGFIIVDADTWVALDFLACMGRRLASGGDARGFGAWQGRYGVLNAGDGWRAALMSGAFDLVNHVKPLGRAGLGLSAGLKGNGMAFTRAVAAQVPWAGASLTEDLDYGLELARRFGLRVDYAPEARVLAQMPASGTQAASQRSRWERGRARAVKERALPLLAEGLRRRSPLLLDAAWDLLVPPLAELAALVAFAGSLVVLGISLHLLPHPALWGAAAAGLGLGLGVYILGGLRVARAPWAAYAALVRAPFYVLWKLVLLARKRRRHESQDWVRTARAPITPVGDAPAPIPARPAREEPAA
jgi:1,2-diacylglycerol 3-beta-glucosyltransferase